MNAPPPPERDPPFMQELRDLIERQDWVSKEIHRSVSRYIKRARAFVFIVMGSAFFGQLLGWAFVEGVKFWLQK